MRRIGNHLLRLVRRQGGGLQLTTLGSQHGVHKQAVAQRSRNAACRGVRAGNEAQLLQIRHHIADGGGRQLNACGARQRARTDGLPVGDVALYQRFQQ